MRRVSFVLAAIAFVGPHFVAALRWLNLGDPETLLGAFAVTLLAAFVLSLGALLAGWRARLTASEFVLISVPLPLAVLYFFALPRIVGVS